MVKYYPDSSLQLSTAVTVNHRKQQLMSAVLPACFRTDVTFSDSDPERNLRDQVKEREKENGEAFGKDVLPVTFIISSSKPLFPFSTRTLQAAPFIFI